ncbi:MAG: radical SAM protein [Bacteroidetes bacterium]|nr:radical SAM protein [Bacteroidota bacterium]
MKFSQFNSIIPFEDKFALYNAFSQKLIFLVPELKELLDAAINEGIANLNNFHPSFYEYLVQQEFIVSENTNEIDKVKEVSERVDNDSSSFILTINPTMNCNFKCWYCYETHIKKSKIDVDVIDRIKLFLDKITEKGLETFSLSFFGGEPLLYFKQTVIPIIDEAAALCEKRNVKLGISFTTNGYLINQDFVNYFRSNKLNCSLQITLDGYKGEHDQVRYVSANKGSYDEIVKNIRLLVENEFFIRLRVNYTDKNISNTHKIVEDFLSIDKNIRDKYLFFDFHRVWQNSEEGDKGDINNLVDSNLALIREKGFDVQTNSPNNVAEPCYADKRNSVVINYNADIYKCTARDFTKANRAGYIDSQGELIWENDYLENRMQAKFKNRSCQTCRIMPLCNGGCSQHAMERAHEDYCIYGGDEDEKSRVVKIKIEEILRNVVVAEPVTSTE